ncbi:hypothetical protein [Myroides odoratus]|uniref:Outer membrane protein beta-barrel domain-containing protein n=1 Tax=Myroides odoratus TaxID=256 RepID=A0A378U1A7_MYROD|nr:hypothetical protein [Myroides odoratus]QQU03774.1 hypothetical protein I6I89_00220 [Myroides odoratus]STZ68946.1 Uncharacterised protein [Myroides odoratus]
MAKKLFIFFFFLLGSSSLWAQGASVFLKFTSTTSQADELGHVTATLELSNLGQSAWTGNLGIESNAKSIRISSSPTKVVRLNPGQKMFVPIIAQVDQSIAMEGNLSIKAKLIADFGPSIPWVEQPILIQKNRRILLLNVENQLQFQQIGDSIYLKALIQNKGNTTEKVHYILTLPSQLYKDKTLAFDFALQPQNDTLLSIQQRISKEAFKLEDFDISATLLYENGDFIARTNYAVSSLKSKRRYKAEDQNLAYAAQSNTVELNRVMGKNVLGATQLIGSATLQFTEKTQLGLTADLIHWDKENKMNLRYFLADFQTEKVQVQAGNIFQSGEFSQQGRGIQTNIKVSDSLYIQAGYLDKTYLITDPNDRSIGYNTWVGFQSQKNRWKQAQLYYDVNHRYDEKKILAYNSFTLWNKPTIQADLNQGTSLLQATESKQLGLFVGLNLYANFNKYQVQHNSFYSSPYYGGMRQGVSQVATTVRRNFDRHSVGIVQHFIDYAPKYSYTNSYNAKQQSNTVGFSYSYRFATSTLAVSPQYVHEKRYNYHTTAMEDLYAVRLNTAFTKSNFLKGLGYNASIDLGNYTTETELQERLHYRINLGLNYKYFDFGLSYQYNYNNLSELINASYYDVQTLNTYTNLMIMGNYRQRFFNNRLGIQFSSYYTHTTTSGDFWQFNTRVEYKLKKDFDVYITNYNNYGGYSSSNQTNYVQVGLIKQLMPYKFYEKSYNLKVLVYYQDEDQTLTPANHRIVTINNKAFVTTDEGTIEYKKLPANTYTIQTQNDKHWFAQVEKIQLNSDVTHIIYLRQTTTVTGSLAYEYTANSFSINKNLAGQRITAQNTQEEVFTTYTSDEGKYAFYLPKGDYILTVYPEHQNQVDVVENAVKISTAVGESREVSFTLKVKEKEVQVKKFKAVSF